MTLAGSVRRLWASPRQRKAQNTASDIKGFPKWPKCGYVLCEGTLFWASKESQRQTTLVIVVMLCFVYLRAGAILRKAQSRHKPRAAQHVVGSEEDDGFSYEVRAAYVEPFPSVPWTKCSHT